MARSKKPQIMSQEQVRQFIKGMERKNVELKKQPILVLATSKTG